MSSQKKSNESAAERFADYFIVCGLDEEGGLDSHFADTDESSLTPFQLSYKPTILWHFPENDPTNAFEEEGIKLLCMPRGVYFRKYVHKNQRKFHSFLQTKEDGTKIYGFVLTFFEEIKNQKLVQAMDTLFKMFDLELMTKAPGNSVAERRKGKRIQRGRSVYSYNKEIEPLYASKCICLIMRQPLFIMARQVLEDILDVGLNETKHELFVESYIYNVLYEIPIPPPGRTMKYLSLGGDAILVTKPNTNELPYFNYSFKEVLMTLGYDNLVDLFTCMLLEHQILFLSNDIHKLMLIAECLSILFFPMLWQHVYVPVLPPSLLHFLDAPVPFIMGLYYENEEEKNRFEIPIEASLCLLDIDNNDIQLPQEIPELPGRKELVEELKMLGTMYGIDPPKGSVRLRHEISKSQEVINLDGSGNALQLADESGNSLNNSPQSTNSGTWPRKLNANLGFADDGSPMLGKRSGISSNSPSSILKVHHDSSDICTIREDDESSVDEDLQNIQLEEISSKNIGLSTKKYDIEKEKAVNPRLATVLAIVEKVGFDSSEFMKSKSPDNLAKKEDLFVLSNRAVTLSRMQQHENEINISIREIFVNRFTQMLVDYEQFVILPRQTKDDWLNNREHMQNFDKAAFLSDQSKINLPFMTLFVETQGFASLIDMKIMALWDDCDPRLAYFDTRIDKLKVKLGIIRSSVYVKCVTVANSVEAYVKRSSHVDHNAVTPHTLKTQIKRNKMHHGYFPMPETAALVETEGKRRKSGKINWRKRDKAQQQNEHIQLSQALKSNQDEGQKMKEKLAEKVKKYMQESKMITKDASQTSTDRQKNIYAFSDKLLKECKLKTKRLVVLKLGQEAVELGHGYQSALGIEENTLIASLCDLLERVWSHGVQLRQLELGRDNGKSRFVQRMRQSKSALWSHLVAFYERQCKRLAAVYGLTSIDNAVDDVNKLMNEDIKQMHQQHHVQKQSTVESITENLSRAIRSQSPEWESDYSNSNEQEKSFNNRSMSLPSTPTMPNMESRRQKELMAQLEFLGNLKTVLGMKEIKTDTGYARAWTRLALEKKVLAKELRLLLGSKKLLTERYKDYAFIRSEDEVEQFLFHLLSLNAVDFFCFTNGFGITMITYKVRVAVGKQIGATTTANCWVNMTGNNGSTGTVHMPKGDLDFRFQHKNLGILTALRIGHDSSGISPSWFIEFVGVTNEMTGHSYKFQCGRWLAKSQDDGSTERLLVAELLTKKQSDDRKKPNTLYLGISDRRNSASAESTEGPRRMSLFTKKFSSADIQELVADSVNNIVKFFFRDSEENMTKLLVGKNGFCHSIVTVFKYGFKSSRLFSKKMFIWDYIERIHQDCLSKKSGTAFLSGEDLKIRSSFCVTVQTINTAALSIGKDQKFELLICLGLRDQHLQSWFKLFYESSVTSHMYEQNSFFRDAKLLSFIIEVLEALKEFTVTLDKSITRGI